jgi:hypothetical protein
MREAPHSVHDRPPLSRVRVHYDGIADFPR